MCSTEFVADDTDDDKLELCEPCRQGRLLPSLQKISEDLAAQEWKTVE